MSAFCSMYAPCLWNPVCETEKPVSCSSAAQSRRCAGPGSEPATSAPKSRLRHRRDPSGVLAIDALARLELIDGRRADVALNPAAEQVVEDAQAQRTANRVDAVGGELFHRRRHDGEAAREHRRALGFERSQRQAADVSRRRSCACAGAGVRPA